MTDSGSKDERPSWDETWMTVARAMAKRSHDHTFKVGVVVVPRENTQALSVGYNGNAPGLPHVRESDEPGKSGFLHAEVNCLLKLDFNHPADKIMYVTLSPCQMCAKMIMACRIKEVVYEVAYRDTSGIELLKQNGVVVRKFGESEEEFEDATDLVMPEPPPLPEMHPSPSPCLNCGRECHKGHRLVTKKGEVYCCMGCAEEDGQDWAQK